MDVIFLVFFGGWMSADVGGRNFLYFFFGGWTWVDVILFFGEWT